MFRKARCSRAAWMGAVLSALLLLPFLSAANSAELAQRAGPPVETTPGVPHLQIGVQPVPELQAEFLRRVALLPGLEIRPTVIGMYGTQGFWLLETLNLWVLVSKDLREIAVIQQELENGVTGRSDYHRRRDPAPRDCM